MEASICLTEVYHRHESIEKMRCKTSIQQKTLTEYDNHAVTSSTSTLADSEQLQELHMESYS